MSQLDCSNTIHPDSGDDTSVIPRSTSHDFWVAGIRTSIPQHHQAKAKSKSRGATRCTSWIS